MTIETSGSELRIGDRIQHSSRRGTIRYIGTVAGHGAKQWAGVEWDDATLGKHSGTLDGRTYFSCPPGAGSFVKLDKLGGGGRASLLECVKKRYTEDALDTAFRESLVVIGGGLVSIEDCDEKRRREVALAGLRFVDVSGMGVVYVKEEGLTQELPEVRELRMARSLFSGVGCVLEVLDAFPRLRVLDASRNVLEENSEQAADTRCESVGEAGEELEEVVLNHCIVSWKTVGRVCERSGKLLALRLHNCKLGRIENELQLTDKLTKLETLDLDGNRLSWDDITRHIGKLKNLREVYLSNNKLCDTDISAEGCMEKVETLSLAHNALDGWKVITWLHSLGKLKNLRIRGNPVTSEEEKDENEVRLTWRMRVIGRIGGLRVLDGSEVSTDERLLCEKRYASEEIGRAWEEDAMGVRKMHPRVEELREMYGFGRRNDGGGMGMRGDMVRVRLMRQGLNGCRDFVVRDMPRGGNMSRVRAVGRRLLGIEEYCCWVGVVVEQQDGVCVEWVRDVSRTLGFWSDTSTSSHIISELHVVIGRKEETLREK